MTSTQDIETRIHKFGEISKIILSMKALASYNVQQAQYKIEQIRTYETQIQFALQDILPLLPEPVLNRRAKKLVVVFGADQGLCGLFNASLAQYAVQGPSTDPRPDYLVIGRRLQELFPVPMLNTLSSPSDFGSIYSLTTEVLGLLYQYYERGDYGMVDIVCNHFGGIGSFQPLRTVLLPLHLQQSSQTGPVPLMDVATEEIFSHVLQEYLYMEIYRAFLESFLSENGVRLVNMNQASQNIDKGIQKLEMESNFVRQNEVTDELSEIISAYTVITEVI